MIEGILKKVRDFIFGYQNQILSFIFILFCLNYVIIRFIFIFSSDYSTINGESPNIWNLLQMLEGRSLYVNPEQLPYEVFMYAPIPQLVYYFFASLLGITQFQSLYVMCRGISFLWNLIAFYFIYRLLRTEYYSLKKDVALWIALMSVFLMTMLNWNTRVDSCSVTLMVVSIVCVVYYIRKQSIKYIIYSAIAASFAFYSKQDGVQLFVIVPFALLIIKEKKAVIYYLLVCFVMLLLLTGLFYVIWKEAFLLNVFGGLNNGISFSQMFYVFNRYFQFYTIFPYVVILICFKLIVKLEEESSDLLFVAFVALSAFVFATGISLKAGSGISYYMFFTCVGTILIGMFLSKCALKESIVKISYLLFLYVFFSGYVYHYITPFLTFSKTEIECKQKIYESFSSKIDENSLVYVDDAVLRLMFSKQSILPNTEYYSVSPFVYKLPSKEVFYIVKDSDGVDYVARDILLFSDLREDKIVATLGGWTLYKK
ncbi:MAG: glycosyltransferase family 39 protein [Bacteroidales bacterium]|nr:glycosyltransferase family 39 protein [Bacteroidales bacterium]